MASVSLGGELTVEGGESFRRTDVDPLACGVPPVTIPRGIAASSSGRNFIAAPLGTSAKNAGAKTPMPQ